MMKSMKWIGAALVALVLALGAPADGEISGPIGGGVEGVVTDLGAGVFQYDYTVYTGGTVVHGDGVGLTFDPGFPVGPVIDSFLIPFFDLEPVAIIPGSIQAPFGWGAAFRDTTASFWSYDPLADPDSGNYEVPAGVFVDPPFVLEFATDIANAGTSGQLAAAAVVALIDGFSFQSNFSDTNGPVVIGYSGGLAVVDPPHVKSPSHPANAVPEPAGLGLIGLAMIALRTKRR